MDRISYELAKELKAAGFPQDFNEGDWGYAERELHGVHGWTDWVEGEGAMYDGSGEYGCGNSGDGFVCAPTLSELIEACGDDFASLQKKVGGYSAFGFGDEDSMQYGYSPTPEEAVAKLWLALHQ